MIYIYSNMVNKKAQGVEWYFLGIVIVFIIFVIYLAFSSSDVTTISPEDNQPPISNNINITNINF